MKNIIFTFFLILMSFSAIFGQQIKIYGYDDSNSLIPVDSVIFGFHPNASIGIDEQLGEQNIAGTPSQTYDLRVLQRTEDDFSCLYDEDLTALTFETGFDSKINLRSPTENGTGRYFEILNMSENFEGGYFIWLEDYIDPQNDINSYYLGFISAYDCPPNFISYNDLLEGIPNIQTHGIIVTPNDWATGSLFKKFYVYIEPDSLLTNITAPIAQSGLAAFFPNPTNGIVNIESKTTLHVELFDAFGKKLKALKGNNETMNLEEFPSGLYYLKFYNENYRQVNKLIKVD